MRGIGWGYNFTHEHYARRPGSVISHCFSFDAGVHKPLPDAGYHHPYIARSISRKPRGNSVGADRKFTLSRLSDPQHADLWSAEPDFLCDKYAGTFRGVDSRWAMEFCHCHAPDDHFAWDLVA